MDIKEIIKSANISQREAARKLGIPYRTMEDWCTGKRKAPQYVTNMIEIILKDCVTQDSYN